MTDKATVEMESPVAGTVVELAGEVGDQVSIGAALVVIETDAAEGDIESCKELGVAGLALEREVEIVTEARPLAALVGMPPEERIEPHGIRVDRHRQHIGSLIEDALRTVAVVQEALRGDGGIVEEAEAAGNIGK
eukprot:gene421-556_t